MNRPHTCWDQSKLSHRHPIRIQELGSAPASSYAYRNHAHDEALRAFLNDTERVPNVGTGEETDKTAQRAGDIPLAFSDKTNSASLKDSCTAVSVAFQQKTELATTAAGVYECSSKSIVISNDRVHPWIWLRFPIMFLLICSAPSSLTHRRHPTLPQIQFCGFMTVCHEAGMGAWEGRGGGKQPPKESLLWGPAGNEPQKIHSELLWVMGFFLLFVVVVVFFCSFFFCSSVFFFFSFSFFLLVKFTLSDLSITLEQLFTCLFFSSTCWPKVNFVNLLFL